MTVQVKTPKEKQAVEIEQGATIRQVGICGDKKMTVFSSVTLLQWLHFTQIITPIPFQFKEAISAKFSGAPVENLCLIFAGKIMKDQETLASHNVKVQEILRSECEVHC